MSVADDTDIGPNIVLVTTIKIVMGNLASIDVGLHVRCQEMHPHHKYTSMVLHKHTDDSIWKLRGKWQFIYFFTP